MRLTYAFPFAALALATAVAANGQNLTVSEPGPIGRAAAERMVEQVVHPVSGQIARFSDGICPTVLGVNEQFGGRIAQRIRQVALAAGAPVAPAGCKGNLLVVFANDPATFFKSVESENPAWLQSVTRYSRKQLENSGDPVLAWHATSVRDADGQPVRADVSAARPVATVKVRETSFMKPVTRQTIDNAFVVVSLSAINGRPIYQIADNVALRALTPVEAPGSLQAPSVLTAFGTESAKAPAMLTAADLGFLRAVYANDGAETAVVERRQLAEAMSAGSAG